jgi:hypothetical protein
VPRLKLPSLTQVSALAGVLASLATVLAVVGVFDDDSDPADPTRSMQQSAAVGGAGTVEDSSSSQQRLLANVPATTRPDCTALKDREDWPRGAVAALTCSLAGTNEVVYVRFGKIADMFAEFRRPPDVKIGRGACPKDWNVQSGFDTPKQDDAGSIRCFTGRNGTAYIEWTRDDLRIYAYASRADDDRRALFKAWNSAGPVPY